MNSYHSRKTPFGVKAVLAVLLASCPVSWASAQEAGSVDGMLLPADVPGQAAPAAPPEFKLPEGASVGDADDKIKQLSSEGAQSLRDLVGSAVSNVREMNDNDARSQDMREINALQMQLDKAKLAKELYKTINGDSDKTKAELDMVKAERDQLSIQVKSLEEQLVSTSKQLQSQAVAPQQPNPVIVRISGAGGSLSAKLLVPYYGETTVRRGDVLANGQTVTSITSNGVSVSRDGETAKLAFGTAVPAAPGR